MSARRIEPEPGALASKVAANDPDWAFGPDATLSAVAALHQPSPNDRGEPLERPAARAADPDRATPAPRRAGRALSVAVLLAVGLAVAARWAWVEVEHRRLHQALREQMRALDTASTTTADRDRRVAELEQQVKQAKAALADARAKLASAEAAATEARSAADELRQTLAAKQSELDQNAKDLEEARQRALQSALDDAKAQGLGAPRKRGGRGSTD